MDHARIRGDVSAAAIILRAKKEADDHLKAQYKQSTGQTGKKHENRLQHEHFPVTK